MSAHESFMSNWRSYFCSYLGERKKLHQLECEKPCLCNFHNKQGIHRYTKLNQQFKLIPLYRNRWIFPRCYGSNSQEEQHAAGQTPQDSDISSWNYTIPLRQAFTSSCLFLSEMGDVIFLHNQGLSNQFSPTQFFTNF